MLPSATNPPHAHTPCNSYLIYLLYLMQHALSIPCNMHMHMHMHMHMLIIKFDQALCDFCVFAHKTIQHTLLRHWYTRYPWSPLQLCSMASIAASTEHESGGAHSSSLPSPWFSSVSRPYSISTFLSSANPSRRVPGAFCSARASSFMTSRVSG